jgi:hypothetical protein
MLIIVHIAPQVVLYSFGSFYVVDNLYACSMIDERSIFHITTPVSDEQFFHSFYTTCAEDEDDHRSKACRIIYSAICFKMCLICLPVYPSA